MIEFLTEYSVDAVDKALYIFAKIKPGISVTDIKGGHYFLKVRSESNLGKFYAVSVDILKDEIDTSCGCPAMGRFGSCKHVAAGAMYILTKVHGMTFAQVKELLDDDNDECNFDFDDDDDDDFFDAKDVLITKNSPTRPTPITELPPGTIKHAETPAITEKRKFIKATPGNIFYNVYAYYGHPSRTTLNNIALTAINEKEAAVMDFVYKQNKSTVYHPQIHYDRNETFFYTCDCKEIFRMCDHVRSAFATLENKGRDFFYKFKNFDQEKNALLQPYGLTVADKEAAEIEFTIDYGGRVSMKPPAWLWKADITDNVKWLKHILAPQNGREINKQEISMHSIIDFEVGFLLNLVSQYFKTGFELEPVKVNEKNNKQQVKKLSLHQKDTLPLLRELPDEIFELMLQLSDDGVKTRLSELGYRNLYNYSSPWGQLDNHGLTALKRHYIGVLQKLWPYLCRHEHVFILKEGSFSNNNITPARLSADVLGFCFIITDDGRYITIRQQVEVNGEPVEPDKIERYCGFLFGINDVLYLPADLTDLDMLWQFGLGYVKIPATGRSEVIRSIIPLLQRKYKVDLPPSLTANVSEMDPVPQVLLKELDGKFLMLQPQYVYQGVTVSYETTPADIFVNTDNGGYEVIKRNAEQEKIFFDSLRVLHPKFQKPTMNNFFFLPFDDTMKQNWFIETMAQMVENKIPILGMQDLKQHRYNTNKPKWEMKAGSGIDWFDLQIEISFGDQAVTLRDVRKALLSGQKIVVLGDGTFGVLPEDWLKQFGLLLKMGDEQKDGTLRVSKLHYTLIDELHSQIDDEEILREINDKKQRLLNIGDMKTVKPDKAIKAMLRPYQVSGFQWFHTLDEMGWGGCLADDMGLGKTLQTITFLQYLKKKYKGGTHLVICPTSLIYNWESELQKFAPSLKYHIYYGLEREFTEEHFNDYDVIITSYGVMRNDLEELMKFSWHYIILDESQAIKNPDAQTNKALQLLKSKNRMILSGTPIQNNTYDLFAQFNFINPGLLGNREFFKNEFANPIDKNNDTEKSAQLRRLIYPFMLRRTKGQVATDLPDKTETILWCDMGKEQRVVYNDYKNYYRNALMEKIKEVGMAKAGMYVLEGLLRLRQICDSPELVKDSEVTTRKSVKIEELLREIEENSGGHKMLVFSQFTEMLHLIEENLLRQKIHYAYLDGSTPAIKRKEAVRNFQEDLNTRVFLISLKAGGVGLNLTAADYVYIVDPWWNPAVEQQAIDRTHRIGQTNKIFAYKMICKDSVEEKILQLQQRKKQLANDLVTEDAGFIKKLTKDDIAFLFS